MGEITLTGDRFYFEPAMHDMTAVELGLAATSVNIDLRHITSADTETVRTQRERQTDDGCVHIRTQTHTLICYHIRTHIHPYMHRPLCCVHVCCADGALLCRFAAVTDQDAISLHVYANMAGKGSVTLSFIIDDPTYVHTVLSLLVTCVHQFVSYSLLSYLSPSY